MTRRFPGLHETSAPAELPDGVYLVRVERVNYRWHAQKPYYSVRFAVIEPKPAISPSAADLRRTIEAAKAAGAKVVVVETYNDPKAADFVAAQIGGKAITLPDHVLGVPEARTYQDLFRYDVRKLIETAKAAGAEPANAR